VDKINRVIIEWEHKCINRSTLSTKAFVSYLNSSQLMKFVIFYNADEVCIQIVLNESRTFRTKPFSSAHSTRGGSWVSQKIKASMRQNYETLVPGCFSLYIAIHPSCENYTLWLHVLITRNIVHIVVSSHPLAKFHFIQGKFVGFQYILHKWFSQFLMVENLVFFEKLQNSVLMTIANSHIHTKHLHDRCACAIHPD